MVESGLAVVDPAADVAPDTLAELLRLEREARAAGRGRWADGSLGPHPAGACRRRARQPSSWCGASCARSPGATTSPISISARTGGATSRFGPRPATSPASPRDGLDVAGPGRANGSWCAAGCSENAGPMIELVHPAADRGGGMRRTVLALVAVGVALGQAACTQVRNPATGELQYTSLSPADERKLGQQEHPKALRQFGGAYEDKAAAGLCHQGRQPGQGRLRAGRRAVHLHAARQRRGQRLRAAGRLCLRHPRAGGAHQQRGRARRRAGPRGRPRHRPPQRAALRPGAARPGRRPWPAQLARHAAGRLSRRRRRVPGWAARAWARPARWVPRPMSRATRATRSSRPTSWASAIWLPPATSPAPWRASSRRCRPTTPTGSGPRTAARTRRAFSATGSAATRARPSASPGRWKPPAPQMPGARTDRPRGAARRRRRHALGRGPGAGRDPGHELPASRPARSRSRRRPASACRTRPAGSRAGTGRGG